MKIASKLRIVAGATLLFAGTAIFAKSGLPTAAAIRDVRPANAIVTVSANSLPGPAASEKSQGLPNANGEKPGNGIGNGHLKGVGLGHLFGKGHGHDSDPESP
jgi:hypothetical protein